MNRSPSNELRVLSGGAVQRGLENLSRAFQEETGHKVILTFATAPVLRSTVEKDGAPFDIVIAPVPLAASFEKRGLVIAGSTAVVGSVKAGVVVHAGVPEPDISTAEALKKEILASHSLVFNEGSSGIYVEELLERLGVAAEAKAKTTRLPNAEAVMKHLARSKTAKEIGFGQITAIGLYANRGVKLVGPLPQEIGNTTTYAASVLAGTRTPELAEQFIRFLVTPSAQEVLRATGVE
jgi:molybdate transport system substrate-binding protein